MMASEPAVQVVVVGFGEEAVDGGLEIDSDELASWLYTALAWRLVH